MAGNTRLPDEVQPYEYLPGPETAHVLWTGVPGLDPAPAGQEKTKHRADPAGADLQKTHSESEQSADAGCGFEAARQQGIQEGMQLARESMAAACAAKEKEWAARIAAPVQQFVEERDRYLHAVEHEVVELALAIAARILRREAQMDPLLLTGAVRVALGQISATTHLRLHVPQADVALWQEAIGHVPGLAVPVSVVAGKGMRLGDCVLETELGSVDLGVRAQLGEIERGFFDRTSPTPARTATEEPAHGTNAPGVEG